MQQFDEAHVINTIHAEIYGVHLSAGTVGNQQLSATRPAKIDGDHKHFQLLLTFRAFVDHRTLLHDSPELLVPDGFLNLPAISQ